MREKKHMVILSGCVLSVSLIAVSVTALLLTWYFGRMHMNGMGQICQRIVELQPEAEPVVLAALKTYRDQPEMPAEDMVLMAYGYAPADLLPGFGRYVPLSAVAGILTGSLMLFVTLLFRHKKETARIHALTDYLEQVNTGNSGVLSAVGADAFSKLQDEIYKTVTMLFQTRDAALKAKQNFAENLYNIAHQIKTPVTAILLSVQMWRQNPDAGYPEQIRRYADRLSRLEEALLLLSRIDAGTLPLEKEQVDVFTVLTLAADQLQELFSQADVSVVIPESGAMTFCGDLDWTMEAVMNLMKNCMEHTPSGGTVYCSYDQNPIYTEIRIWDTGAGFARQDLPHLFERFYRGENAGNGGIGIGLALSREIMERQNGTISARNLAGYGACFEIRVYSH